MDGICRLCCSLSEVDNLIFDEQKSTYLKLSTCLPVKVKKDDNLPQKICNRCCGRLEDCYRFVNEAVTSQVKLRQSMSIIETFKSEIDLTENVNLEDTKPLNFTINTNHKSTQTGDSDNSIDLDVQVKQEKNPELKPFSPKVDFDKDDNYNDDREMVPSDYSDDINLLVLKKKKKKFKKDKSNGEKKKRKRKDYELTNENGAPDNFDQNVQVKREWLNVTELLETTFKTFETEDVFYCCICFLQFITKADIIVHYKTHAHNFEFKLDVNDESNIVKIGSTISYKCRMCLKMFENKDQLSQHVAVHNDGRPYRCSLCEKTFKDASQIFRHGQSHSYQTPQTTSVAECVMANCPIALKGELCPDEHLEVKQKTFPQPLNKRFICDLCDEGFVYMRYLMEHRSRVHPEASNRKLINRCMHCSREFAHLNSLRRHLRSHSGEKNYLCNVCGKSLSSREHLKFHIRIHTGFKPNVCKTCGKGFVKKCNLTLHERVHSGEKPHVCSHCGKAFSQRSTLVIHER